MQSAVYRDLRDRRVLVTGASSGIGAACARAFLLQGSRVALHHHTGSVAELAASFPDRGLPVRGDLSGEEGCIIVADAAAAALGGLDVLVCSAGIWEAAPVATIGADQLERMFRINLFSAIFLIRESLPHLGERSSIVLVGSTAGQRGEAGHAHYAASKGGLHALALSLAEELAPRTRVNVVAPGWVRTPMTRTALAERGARIVAGIPLRRIAEPEDVAQAVLFLASDASRHITGEILGVSGGALVPMPR